MLAWITILGIAAISLIVPLIGTELIERDAREARKAENHPG